MTQLMELAERVQRAGEAVAELDPAARDRAVELREAVEAMHAAGLRDIVRVLLADEHGATALRAAAREPAARAILMLHGILQPDLATQAETVLARLRPTLQGLGGDVEVDHVEDRVLFVRLTGSCEGQSATARAYQEQVCEVLAEQVEGLESVQVAPAAPPPVVVPLDAMLQRVRREPTEAPVGSAGAAAASSADLAQPNAVADSVTSPLERQPRENR